MLIAIRSTVASWSIKILFGVLIASFAVWGVGDIFRGGFQADTEVAEVGDLSITLKRLDRAFRREMARIAPAFGGEFDRNQARALGLLDQALEQLIVRSLFQMESDRLAMSVSDRQVRAWIDDQPRFRDALGQLDRQRFGALLRQLQMSEAEFVALMKMDLAQQQIIDAVSLGASAPRTLAKAIHTYRAETRVADTVLVPYESMQVAPPDDEAARTYHRENPKRFTTPETRRITYVAITAEDLIKEIKVPESDIQADYEDRRTEFTVEERRQVEQMVLAGAAEAERAKTMLDQGRDFAEVARELTGEADPAALSLGELTRSEFPLPEFAQAVFGLDAGGISAPLESPLGRHIFRVTKIEPGRVIALEEVRDRLATDLATERALDVMFELANKLEDELAGGASLETAARRLALQVTRVDGLDRAGGSADGAEPAVITARVEFLSVAFETDRGEESVLTETSDGGFFILRVDFVAEPAVRPFEQVRQLAIEAVSAERRRAAAEAEAGAILEAVKAGQTLAAAAERGLETRMSAGFTRDGRTEGLRLPGSLIADMFQAAPGGVAMAPTGEGYMVARLEEVRAAAAPAASDGALGALSKSLDEAVRSDLLVQFTTALRGRYTVSVNQAAIDSLFRQP